jgi:asparagine synthetase B (glutamine-hydrolysing)
MTSQQYQAHLFARGYCIYPSSLDFAPPDRFRVHPVDGWVIASHPTCPVTTVQNAAGNSFVAIIGYVLDIANAHDSSQRVANDLLRLLEISEDSFLRRLDDIGGRHVVFYGRAGDVSLVGDACMTKTAYYGTNQPFVASHASMAALVCGTEPSTQKLLRDKHAARRQGYGYPAGTTPYRNVMQLMANTLLRLPTMAVERFYPRAPIAQKDVSEVSSLLLDDFTTQTSVLRSSFQIYCSLTGGLDSRISLASFRDPAKDAIYFTYLTQPAHSVDALLATDIAAHCGLRHRLLTQTERPAESFGEFKRVISKNTYHSHNIRAAFRYLDLFDEKSIHLRSNLFEIGRGFYRGKRSLPASLSAEGMRQLYLPQSGGANDDITESFEHYIHRSSFDRSIFNFDPYDVFYWEQRMSCWHALVLVEADPSTDTYQLFNSRRCIEVALSLPLHERVNGAVFKSIISARLPALADFPINPRNYISRDATSPTPAEPSLPNASS